MRGSFTHAKLRPVSQYHSPRTPNRQCSLRLQKQQLPGNRLGPASHGRFIKHILPYILALANFFEYDHDEIAHYAPCSHNANPFLISPRVEIPFDDQIQPKAVEYALYTICSSMSLINNLTTLFMRAVTWLWTRSSISLEPTAPAVSMSSPLDNPRLTKTSWCRLTSHVASVSLEATRLELSLILSPVLMP